VLLLKGHSLAKEAGALRSESNWPELATVIGFLLGGLKGLTLFRRSCNKNLDRIDGLENPKIWGFFRPRFIVLLSLMIFTGATLSRMAHGNFGFLIGVAILDISIGTALLLSSYAYWKRRAFV